MKVYKNSKAGNKTNVKMKKKNKRLKRQTRIQSKEAEEIKKTILKERSRKGKANMEMKKDKIMDKKKESRVTLK